MKSNTVPIMNIKINLKLVISVVLFLMLNISCRKYVDIQTGNNKLTISSANDCQLLLDNYSLNNNGLFDGEASADDYYLTKSGFLATTVTVEDRSIYTWATNAIRNSSDQWKNMYYNVYYTNLVLEAGPKLKSAGTDQATQNTIRGSALFLRSFYFWQLAQLYAKPYTSTAGQDPGIPLRLSSDINDKSSRGTVAGTYSQIISDLQEAVSLLPVISNIATRPNKVAAYALLARVYLSMEDYPNAQINANAALQLKSDLIDYNSLDASSGTPFFPRFNKEIIFQAIMADGATMRQNVARIDSNLIATYNVNDLRSKIFFQADVLNGQDANGNPIVITDGKYFKGNYEPSSTGNFFDGLAVDELYLIRAECYSRSGNVSAAMNDLNTLLRTRWVTNMYTDMTATSADDALAKILMERRKELIMRGLRWTDLRRLNKDSRFVKTLTRVVSGLGTFSLPPNDMRYVLLIPQPVIDNSSIAQNPR